MEGIEKMEELKARIPAAVAVAQHSQEPAPEPPAQDIDKLLGWLGKYTYAEYLQVPACGQARLGEALFETTKVQLAERWQRLKTLAAEIQSLEELLLL